MAGFQPKPPRPARDKHRKITPRQTRPSRKASIAKAAVAALAARMTSTLVMTVIGPDRTGLVDDLARTVAAHGGNWQESRMCHLGGRFAGLMRVVVPAEQVQLLQTALAALGQDGLTVVVQDATEPGGPIGTTRAAVELVG
jgi:glycine cleavage system regulatory protein